MSLTVFEFHQQQQILTFSKYIKVLFTFLYVLFAITSVSFRDELEGWQAFRSSLLFLLHRQMIGENVIPFSLLTSA